MSSEPLRAASSQRLRRCHRQFARRLGPGSGGILSRLRAGSPCGDPREPLGPPALAELLNEELSSAAADDWRRGLALGDSLKDEDMTRPGMIREVNVKTHPNELPTLVFEFAQMLMEHSRVKPGIHARQIPDVDGVLDGPHQTPLSSRARSYWGAACGRRRITTTANAPSSSIPPSAAKGPTTIQGNVEPLPPVGAF
jgi:hypothetical protein